MTDKEFDQKQLATRAIRDGISRSHEGEHSEALFMTSSYVFENAEHAAHRFSGEELGNVYSRYTNPTVRGFEERFASIEQAPTAVATGSGMAAILSVMMTFLEAGDRVVCSQSVFGSTISLLENFFRKMSIDIDYAIIDDPSSWTETVTSKTKLVFVETPSNPLNQIADLKFLSRLAKQNNALLVVDNTYCTPIIQRPLALGADVSLYSTTKYIDGQGRSLGGVVTGSQELMDRVVGFVRSAGPSMSPFNAWLCLKSLETLELRMLRHVDSALKIANWLEQHESVSAVYHSGLPSHPQYELAQRQHIGGHGSAVVSFDVTGDVTSAWRVIDALRIFSITANLGDAKSTVVHPATTTHSRVSPEERAAVGIKESLVRLSIGLEACDDLINDLSQALKQL
ncbi:MAG: O-succinylhomoserine sulfhydrylase [Pseudomonadota bacterium]